MGEPLMFSQLVGIGLPWWNFWGRRGLKSCRDHQFFPLKSICLCLFWGGLVGYWSTLKYKLLFLISKNSYLLHAGFMETIRCKRSSDEKALVVHYFCVFQRHKPAQDKRNIHRIPDSRFAPIALIIWTANSLVPCYCFSEALD